MQGLFNWPETEEFAYECMVLRELDFAVDSLAGEVNCDSFGSFGYACGRNHLWLWHGALLIPAIVFSLVITCRSSFIFSNDQIWSLICFWKVFWDVQRIFFLRVVRGRPKVWRGEDPAPGACSWRRPQPEHRGLKVGGRGKPRFLVSVQGWFRSHCRAVSSVTSSPYATHKIQIWNHCSTFKFHNSSRDLIARICCVIRF